MIKFMGNKLFILFLVVHSIIDSLILTSKQSRYVYTQKSLICSIWTHLGTGTLQGMSLLSGLLETIIITKRRKYSFMRNQGQSSMFL